MITFLNTGLSLLVLLAYSGVFAQYQPNWDSLDKRPLPDWYDNGKIGIFIHWGVFAVPSYGSEWFWQRWQQAKYPDFIKFMQDNFKPDFTYPDFAKEFTAEFYNSDDWADLFKDSGAQYVVLTSKHHEGFTLWPSKVSWNWNAMDVGPKKDLVGNLADSIRRRTNLHFGLYHSLFEWFNPLYLQDSANKFKTNDYVTRKTMPELYELVNNYRPEIIWSDGDSGPDTYWNSTGFLAWLYNESPVKDTVVVNDRWGDGCSCKHGGYFTCMDRFNPGKLLPHKWENAMTIDRSSWGFRRNAKYSDYLSTQELIQTLAQTISCNGNLLINVGPTKEGIINPIFQDRLREFGKWLQVNGEAVYSSKPWKQQNDSQSDVWYTSKGSTVYAFVLSWPKDNLLILENLELSNNAQVTMLGLTNSLFNWSKQESGGTAIQFPLLTPDLLPCKYAWVLKITGAL